MWVNEYFNVLAGKVISKDSDELEVLMFMALIHTHYFLIEPHIVFENYEFDGNMHELSAVTNHHAAKIVSNIWKDSNDKRKSDSYWFWLYKEKTPYEIVEEIPEQELKILEKLQIKLKNDKDIYDVVEED